MQRELELPDVGEGIAEGEILTWLIKPGEEVEEDQALAEVETDKAVVEIPSPTIGTISTLHAEEGEMVAVGSLIVTIVVDGTEDQEAENGLNNESTDTPVSKEEGAPEQTAPSPEPTEESTAIKDATEGITPRTDASMEDENSTQETIPASQVIAPPGVKRLARELDVDIGDVDGATEGNRITEADVRQAANETAENTDTTDTAEATQQPGESPEVTVQGEEKEIILAEPASRDKTLAAPATRQLASELSVDINVVPSTEKRGGHTFVTPAAVKSFATGNEGTFAEQPIAESNAGSNHSQRSETLTNGQREERIPYQGIRRTIGERMEQAAFTAPHVSHHDTVDATELATTREELNNTTTEGLTLTYLPFLMKAVVASLQDYPNLNAILDEENDDIVRKHYYNIGIATATDAGLMVPVIENVDQKSLAQLARELDDITGRARSQEISPHEMQGGTFTITNFGAIGGDYATPIINYPEAAILGLGTIEKRATIVEDEVIPRLTLPLSVSVDHRLIDGAIVASFTNELKQYLNDPSLLLL